ncbi:MAG: CHAT domain-containing protein [Saprospiraceae bacterium]|nr:CHAT domain-containing protein [Saprospiraceae bacterium]
MYWLLIFTFSILSWGTLCAQFSQMGSDLDKGSNDQYISLDWVCRAHAIIDYRKGKKAREEAKYIESIQFYEKALQKLTYSYYLDSSNTEVNTPYLPQLSDLSNIKLSSEILSDQIDNYEQQQQWIFAQVIAQYKLALVQRSLELDAQLDWTIIQNAYEELIHIEILLYQKTSTHYYLEQAFFHIEEYRQYELYQEIFGEFITKNRDLAALVQSKKTYAEDYRKEGMLHLRDFCIEKGTKEYNCKHDQQLHHLSQWEELVPEASVLTKRIANRQKIELQIRNIKDSLHQYHPRYYHLRYAAVFSNMKQIQEELPNQNVMLNLWKHQNQLYRFVIAKDTIQFDVILWDSLQEAWLKDVEQAIYKDSVQQLSAKPRTSFIQSSHLLYQHLFNFLNQERFLDLEEILVVASDKFLAIPFDVCLTGKYIDTTTEYSWQNLPYLTRKIAIYRSYSAVWWEKIPDRIAPVYAHNLLHLDFLQNTELSTDFLTNVHYSDEITEAFLNKMIHENRYSVVHLSVDYSDSASLDKKPYFLFNEQATLKLSEQLHAYQVRNMRAKVDIFSLELLPKGSSLSMNNVVKNFQYTGHPSVVLFNPSTSYITHKFYDYLTQWDNKAVALQRAKNAYLTTKHAEELYYHPYFWENNHLYGNTEPIRLQRRVMVINNWGLLGLCLLTLIVGIFVYKKWRLIKEEEMELGN